MSNARDPAILAAYEAVRSDSDPTTWLLVSYAGTTGSTLTLTATGTAAGSLAELASALADDGAQYAYARVEYANDEESRRVKFVFVTWIGERTGVMRKARVSVESGHVKTALGHYSIVVEARERADLDEAESEWSSSLLKASVVRACLHGVRPRGDLVSRELGNVAPTDAAIVVKRLRKAGGADYNGGRG